MNTESTLSLPLISNWIDSDGKPAGGQSTGIGFTIAWQRGPLIEGRNGAFLLDVLEACQHRLRYYSEAHPEFACKENDEALSYLTQCIQTLNDRKNRRAEAGTLGTHVPDIEATPHGISYPEISHAVNFDDLIAYGRASGAETINGMPSSFDYKGHRITYESGGCYVMHSREGMQKITPDDMLVSTVGGRIYPCNVHTYLTIHCRPRLGTRDSHSPDGEMSTNPMGQSMTELPC